MHTGEKPYSCDVCQKSYTRHFELSRHNKSATHNEKIKRWNTNDPFIQNSFIDCGESIKEEDIKEEIKEEESVGDPLTIHQEIDNSYVCEDIKEELKGEESVDDPLTIHQEIENSNICEDIKKGIKEEKNVEVSSFNQQELGNAIFFTT